MQNIDAETGLQSKKEPSLYFLSQKTTRRETEITNPNNGDHHFVFGNDSPRLPLEVNQLKKYFERDLDQGLDPAVLRIAQTKFILRNTDKFYFERVPAAK